MGDLMAFLRGVAWMAAFMTVCFAICAFPIVTTFVLVKLGAPWELSAMLAAVTLLLGVGGLLQVEQERRQGR